MTWKAQLGAALVVLLGLAALFQTQQLKIERLVTENADLRRQLGQIGSLRDTNDLLAEQLKAADASSQTNQSELLRLRGQRSRFRQLEQENAQLKAERQQPQVTVTISDNVAEVHDPATSDYTNRNPSPLESHTAEFISPEHANLIVRVNQTVTRLMSRQERRHRATMFSIQNAPDPQPGQLSPAALQMASLLRLETDLVKAESSFKSGEIDELTMSNRLDRIDKDLSNLP